MPHELSHHHRNTIEEIFRTPTSHNVEWRKVRSLLDAVGEVEQEHNGKFIVYVGATPGMLHVPHGKDLDTRLVVDVRRLLEAAGLAPES
mgnify:CR=1 FL=1